MEYWEGGCTMEASWLCGLVDIGSNTIRGVIYQVKGSQFQEVASRCDFASLITFVEHDLLTSEGCIVLSESLGRMASFFVAHHCQQIHCFATASLRGIQNFPEAQQKAAEMGFQLELLSGEEEARCDFFSLLHQISVPTGVGLDLGGGSGQLFCFTEGQLREHISRPIGVSAMKKRFSASSDPGWEAAMPLCAFVQEQLAAAVSFKQYAGLRIYGMGGSLRAAVHTSRILWGVDSAPVLTVEQLTALFQALRTLEGRSAALQADADRLPTLGSGLLVLKTICEYMGAAEIEFVDSSVREGYLWKNIIKQ